MKDYQLTACSDTERRAPEREAGRDVEVHRSALLVAVTAFEQSIGKPSERPYLSAVRMSAEEQVGAGLLRLQQLDRLMIQYDDRSARVDRAHQLSGGKALSVAAVVTPDELYPIRESRYRVAQQTYGRLPDIFDTCVDTADVFVIARRQINTKGRFDLLQLLLHECLAQRVYAMVDQVATDDHEVRLLGINSGDVILQTRLRSTEPEMDVADGNDLEGSSRRVGQRLGNLDMQVADDGIAVTDISVDKHSGRQE